MKLLHSEVDITPGRPGTRQAMSPVQEGLPLPGSAVVRLTNTTSQNNAYTLRLRCDGNPFWQESWYRLIPLPPAPGEKNTIPAGKRDEVGPQGTTLKLYILSGGSREVLIQFSVPKSAEARAGRYDYLIEVETQILNVPNEAARRDNLVTKLPGVAIIRPFYLWSFDLKKTVSDPRPGEPMRVSRLRPATTLELVVTNEGNDWLYCDVLLPQPNDMETECFTRRLAVRPPEPGELLPSSDTGGDSRPGTQRHLPIAVRSRLRTLRGNPTTQAVPLSLQRVDAPTVAPPAEDEFFVGTGKVLCKPTAEKQALPGERAIVYHPPVPATLTDFFRGAFSSGRTLVMSAIGLVVAAHIAILMYQQIFYRSIKINVQGGDHFALGEQVKVDGSFLQGAVFFLGNKTDDYVEIENAKPVSGKKNEYLLTLPPEKKLDGKSVNVRVQRYIGLLPYLTRLLPVATSRSFEYGAKPVVHTPKPDPEDRTLAAGQQTFTIHGRNLGQPGTVFVNGIGVRASSWKESVILAYVPRGIRPGEPLPVEVQPDGVAARLPAGSITIVQRGGGGGGGGEAPQLGQVSTGPYKPGDTFTISGQNLKSGLVRLGRRPVPSDWSPEMITATIPEGTPAGTLSVMVQPEGGALKNVGSITIEAPAPPERPQVAQISGRYKPGDTLPLTGSALGGGGIVYLGSMAVRPTSWSATQITLTIPQMRPGTVPVEVAPSSGGRLNAGSITIEAGGPPVPTPTTAYDALIQGNYDKALELSTQRLQQLAPEENRQTLEKAEQYAIRALVESLSGQMSAAREDASQANGLSTRVTRSSPPAAKRARALAILAWAFYRYRLGVIDGNAALRQYEAARGLHPALGGFINKELTQK